MTFTGIQMAELKGPIVYIWWRLDACMYVGYSRRGLSRPFGSHDHLPEQWTSQDRLEIHTYVTPTRGKEAEREAIALYKPLCNKQVGGLNILNSDNMKSAKNHAAKPEAD